jgi:hypothetical protein
MLSIAWQRRKYSGRSIRFLRTARYAHLTQDNMKSTNWNTPLTGAGWTAACMAVWIIGVGLVGAYGLKTIDDFQTEAIREDCVAGFAVVALFATAQILGRKRFLKHRTIKYFCITAVTSLFLCVMDVERFTLMLLNVYPAIVAAYLVALGYLATRRSESRK